jgi:23S rRNA pseudouridine1911/1915/1917 synthase
LVEFIVAAEQAGKRLDLFLVEVWEQAESRSSAQRAIKAGEVLVNGKSATRVSAKVNEGHTVQVSTAENPKDQSIYPTNIPLDVVYEDDDIAVIDKPVGMTVHPAAGHTDDTLANGALHRWPRIRGVGEPDRPGIVHRLDKDTSGLMVVALSARAYGRLKEMIYQREITRIYSALVHGIPESAEGVVDAPIGRSRHSRKRQAISEDGLPSRTHYRVDYELGDFAFLEIRLETGRMHQIRVHMDAIGHPVIGDQTYGRRKNLPNLNRQFLHASRLEFSHPISGKKLSLTSDIPEDLQRALETLR